MKAITTFLGFNTNAEEAVNVYVPLFNEVFGNSEILHITRFDEGRFPHFARCQTWQEIACLV